MSEKAELRHSVDGRRVVALAVLKPQWRRCFWMKPRGHIRDGTRSPIHHYRVCVYCGCPESGMTTNDVVQLEKCVAEMGRYPIALGVEKGTVPA